MSDRLTDVIPATVQKQVSAFLTTGLNVLRHVRDAMVDRKIKQKEQEDAKGRCLESYEFGDRVLPSAKNLTTNVVSAAFKTKLRPRFIGLCKVVTKKVLAYTLNLP